MCRRWIKAGIMLAVLLLAMVSISMAACPRAMNDLYRGNCGEELTVSAANGLLKNDVVKPTGTILQVVDPDSIKPSLGTIEVREDGSFIYTAPTKIASGTYVTFRYKATDGSCVSNQALAKIQVGCKCRGNAPDLTFCEDTEIDEADLMAGGAGCQGCGDATPAFDLSQIGTETGVAYPYIVKCPGCAAVTGHVTFLICPTCDDGIQNGDETGVDCGGSVCEPCVPLNPECAPATCENFIPCNEGGSCGSFGVCASVAEGSGVCVDGRTPCAGLAPCTSTSDCAAGEICGVNSCCGAGVCVPTSAFCLASEAPARATANTATTGTGPTVGKP